jgi:hypothetical protein
VVSASGDNAFDPDASDTGMGGRTQGNYDLRVTLQPDATASIVDSDGAVGTGGYQTPLDGDGDGIPGGEHNFWFNVADGTNNRTVFVDKVPSLGGGVPNATYPLGGPQNPYKTISGLNVSQKIYGALTNDTDNNNPNAARDGDIVRVVGNNSADDNFGRTLTSVAGSTAGLDG